MTPRAGRRPGRPAGASETRERILTTARGLFARDGFDRTSVRSIARAADVDAALVHHYFGTKQQLFAAAIRLPVDPAVVLGEIREVPAGDLGHAVPAILLRLWDSEAGTALVATTRSLLGGSDVSLVRSFLEEVIGAQVAPRVDDPPGSGRVRVQFMASQLVGIVVTRYIIGLEPLASLTAEQVAKTVGPTLQRYLTGDLPGVTS